MTQPLGNQSVALVGASLWLSDSKWIVKQNEGGTNHQPSDYLHICATVEPLPCPDVMVLFNDKKDEKVLIYPSCLTFVSKDELLLHQYTEWDESIFSFEKIIYYFNN